MFKFVLYSLLLCFFLGFLISANAEKKRVVIVGAGAAGIAAATRLYETGIKDIVILEAESRIGGRVHTIDVKSNVFV